ncbi:hypothetical protein BP6252_07257 [Coleophoma cylindrospora]|uniref:Uncharacterized protein n=1 Tax=Coleophoma cylindrospora TaxID=1849047 RepID=A0A3D8RHA5_9HELO|nr:hypothetical protein BP6252_07257 [Coleophoma cylindrospora]
MSLLNALATFSSVFLLYLIWAVVYSDSLFHRVWSLGLCCLLPLATALFSQHISIFTAPLFLLTILDLALCIALSPAQVLLFHSPTQSKRKVLDIIFPPSTSSADHEEAQKTTIADIVVVHGLASSQTTWEAREEPAQPDLKPQNASQALPATKLSWVHDFLPQENLNCRIMVFNHNTRWEDNALSKSLSDHGDDLVRALSRARQKSENRPIIFIGHSFGGLIIKQAMVNASVGHTDLGDFIHQQARGFIFLGTPHKGSRLTAIGKRISLLGYWKGSSTNLLDNIEPESEVNRQLHEKFMNFLKNSCRVENTLCIFEAVKEFLYGFQVTHVVERHSAVIDGSQSFGSEGKHRDIQRYAARDNEDYQDILSYIRERISEITNLQQNGILEQMTKDQKDCLSYLCFPQMDVRQHDINPAANDTCTWLLKHDRFHRWANKKRELLWISGNPGAGKSTLLKYALQQTSQARPQSQEKALVLSFFFHGRGHELQKTTLGFFRSVLHQILKQSPSVAADLVQDYKKNCETKGKPGEKWDWHQAELQGFFKKLLARASGSYPIQIFVDALDECGETVARDLVNQFQDLIKQYPNESTLNFHICFTCRHYPIITIEFGEEICVEQENNEDIATYVRSRLKDDSLIKNEIRNIIIENASGIFQWARLVVDQVENMYKDGELVQKIKETLRSIPSDLSSLYRTLFEGVLQDEETRETTLGFIEWILFATRPLSLDELRFATAITPTLQYTSLQQCRDEGILIDNNNDFERRVRKMTRGLAEVRDQAGKSTVQFIHQSVNDFLVETGLQILYMDNWQSFDLARGKAHYHLSRSCIRYIDMEEMAYFDNVELATPHSRSWEQETEFPFLQYATNSWVAHTAKEEESGIIQEDLLHYFRWPSNDLIHRWAKIINLFKPLQFDYVPRKLTLLHIMSRYGLKTPLLSVFKTAGYTNVDIDLKDQDGRSPLSWAAENGHEAVIKLLLATGQVDVDSKDKYSRSPLSRAAQNGHEAVIKLLLATGQVENGWSPLSWAARGGKEAVVALLLATGQVEVESKDQDGRTALPWAAENGHETIVKMLLDKGADITSENGSGWTALHRMAIGGNRNMELLLVDHGALEPEDFFGLQQLFSSK